MKMKKKVWYVIILVEVFQDLVPVNVFLQKLLLITPVSVNAALN